MFQVFVGLGEPFEGPAALEALANGCFFLNPKVWLNIVNCKLMIIVVNALSYPWYCLTTEQLFHRRAPQTNEEVNGRTLTSYIFSITTFGTHVFININLTSVVMPSHFLKFEPPYDRVNHGFYAGKPMNRKVKHTSF